MLPGFNEYYVHESTHLAYTLMNTKVNVENASNIWASVVTVIWINGKWLYYWKSTMRQVWKADYLVASIPLSYTGQTPVYSTPNGFPGFFALIGNFTFKDAEAGLTEYLVLRLVGVVKFTPTELINEWLGNSVPRV